MTKNLNLCLSLGSRLEHKLLFGPPLYVYCLPHLIPLEGEIHPFQLVSYVKLSFCKFFWDICKLNVQT